MVHMLEELLKLKILFFFCLLETLLFCRLTFAYLHFTFQGEVWSCINSSLPGKKYEFTTGLCWFFTKCVFQCLPPAPIDVMII